MNQPIQYLFIFLLYMYFFNYEAIKMMYWVHNYLLPLCIQKLSEVSLSMNSGTRV